VSSKVVPEISSETIWVGANHLIEGDPEIRSWGLTDDPMFPPTFKFAVPENAVLLHSRNPKKIARTNFALITGEKLFALQSRDESVLLTDFLLAVLQAQDFQNYAVTRSGGSVNKFLNWTPLADYEFLLPPLGEQKRIVEVIAAAQRARAGYRATSQAESRLRAALLQEMDMQGTRVPLGSVASIQRGASYKSDDYAADGSGKPFLTLKSVSRSGEYEPKGLKWVRKNFDSSRSAAPGDLFIANTDLTPGKLLIGAPFFFPGEESELAPAFSMDLSRVAPNDSSVSAELLYFALSAPRVRQEMRLHSGGSTVAHLRLSSVPQIEIAIPSPSRQEKLIAQLRGVERASTAAVEAERTVSELAKRAIDVLGKGPKVV
jgi:type I restriction enzyme S subunit